MDISKADAKVCVRIVPEGKVRAVRETTTWGAKSREILELGDYLRGQQVSCVVMEATGDYWKPFYYLLSEVGLQVVLANARQVRQIPGRKTDVADAVWLADLAAHGLVRGSFVPPPMVRELRDLVRARTICVRLRGEEAQRLEKLMESAAIKLSSTLSNIVGVSARNMIQAMINGQRDPQVLATLTAGKVKASHDELVEALTGRFTEHHAFLAEHHLGLIDDYTERIGLLSERIGTYFDPEASAGPAARIDPSARRDLALKRDLLTSIPGIDTLTAEKVLAEIGPDMSVFGSPGHLTSWAGIAPGANESAGRVKPVRCRPGDRYLKGALGIAALAAVRSKDTFLHARYKRICSRRGHSRALVATERTILVAIWHILTDLEPYHELGADYYVRRRPGRAIRKAIQQLRTAGVDITFTSTTQAVVT